MKLTPIAGALLFSAVFLGCSQNSENAIAGIKLVEEVPAVKGKLNIPYKKYELDNGLTLIIHEDNSDPLVHVDVTYHVGSAREDLGKSGYAHLFEHMMYQGSKHVADDEHFKTVTEAGGKLNGTTNNDRTNYFQTVPANQLETMLWLESDRMGFFAEGITQEKFEVQRDAVKNERAMRLDNVPYARWMETMNQTLYDYGHPYSWLPIGHISDLNRASAQDLQAFFSRWYGPNNATLTIGGAVKAEDVLPLVKKYFGSIPAGQSVDNLAAQPARLTENRYTSFEDNVTLPLLAKAYPSVHMGHKDQAALDVLTQLLGQGSSSPLYQTLVQSGLSVQADLFHQCRELACEITYIALPHPASALTLRDMDLKLLEVFAEFERRGVTQQEIDLIISRSEAEMVRELQSVEGKASALARYQTYYSDANYISMRLENKRAVTPDDVMRVYRQYIKGKPAAYVSVVPHGQAGAVIASDNFKPEFFKPAAGNKTQPVAPVLPVIKDNFDRSVKPTPAAAQSVRVPEYTQRTLSNGIQTLLSQSEETPTTDILIRVPAGQVLDPHGQSGTALLLARMLDESTTRRSKAQRTNALDALGSKVDMEIKRTSIDIHVSAMTARLDETLILVHEQLLMPAFDEDDFKRVKAATEQQLKHMSKDANALADAGIDRLLYGEHNYGKPVYGVWDEMSSLSLDDVKRFYQQQVLPQGTQVIAVTSLKPERLVVKLENTFSTWQGQAKHTPAAPATTNAQKGVVYLVNKQGAKQAELRVGKNSAPFDVSGEHFQSTLMNFTFSGNFNSRLMLNLREARGYTYGVRGVFEADKLTGGYKIQTGVRPDAVAASLVEIQREMQTLRRDGLNEEEVAFMRQAINQRDALKYETPLDKLGFLSQIIEYQLNADFVTERSETVRTVSKAQLDKLAREYLNPKDMMYVVVGDEASLKPQLKRAGFEVRTLL